MYHWSQLSAPTDLATLANILPAEFGVNAVVSKLSKDLSNAVKSVLVEQDYIDKDYRSTYYNFYSKKGQRYRSDCIRLHFFDAAVRFDEASLRLSTTAGDQLSDHYFGYMILRPTGIGTIGRTVVSPDVRNGASRYIITARHKVHVLGHKLEIRGFPSMDQHIDISVCAHSACWSILRHYSERYPLYREFLTHDITMMAQDFDPGGLVPSKGLEMENAERVFQQAGTYPLHIARGPVGVADAPFYRQLTAYVESGFPLFAAMHSRGHAIAVIGYGWRQSVGTSAGLRYAWDEVESLAVVDDNYLPYLSIPVSGGTPYSAHDIDAFIVALPEKIFYPADAVDKLAATLIRFFAPMLGLPPEDQTVIRYFITTGSALRSLVRERESEYDQELLKRYMSTPFAQFVWVVEFSSHDQWSRGQIEARAVVDATASVREPMPLWLFHSRTEALILDRNGIGKSLPDRIGALTLSASGHAGFTRMTQNLRATQTK